MSLTRMNFAPAAMLAVCIWACGCAAQARPHGIDGDTLTTVYPAVEPGATRGVTYQPGILGLALSLDEVGACVREAREGSLDIPVGTLELWLSPKVPVREMTDFSPIVSAVADPFIQSIQGSMLLFVANSGTDSRGQIVFAINPVAGDAGAIVATPPLDWAVGSWHHVSATWGPKGMALRVDGEETMANKSAATARRPADMIGIGGHATPGAWAQPCEFLIDELRISSTQRSPEETTKAIARVRQGEPLQPDERTLLLEHFDGSPLPPVRLTSGHPANIIPEGAEPVVYAAVATVGEDEVPLTWELTDLEGLAVASGEATATDEEPAGLRLGGVGPGIYNLRASVVGAEGPSATGATTVWLEAPPEGPLMDAASGFGQSSCFARDLDEDVFAAQRRMGVKWSRVSFVWSEIEPENDRFKWDKYDEIVRLAGKYGVELVPTFMWEDPIPAWAGPQQTEVGAGLDNKRNLPPEDLEDWRDYVHKVVTRYRDSVDWWIPWNEPNLPKYLGPEQDAAKYVELLRACAEAIRDADPDARLCGLSVSLVDLPFYQECFKLGALEYCDAVGCHPYRMGFDPDERAVGLNRFIGLNEPRTWLEELRELRALIDKYADGRQLGIWLDEMGQPTEEDFVIPDVAVTEQTAAVYLARMYAQGLGTGVIDRGLWFAFHGYGSFSLVRDDFALKPEAIAYRLLASALAGKRGVPDDARSDEVRAYRFDGDGSGAWVVWTKEPQQDVELDGVPADARAYDIFGRPAHIDLQAGIATVQAGPTPVVVEW